MMLGFGRARSPGRTSRPAVLNLLMSPFPRPYPPLVLAAALLAALACAAQAQAQEPQALAPEQQSALPPPRANMADQSARARMSESVRRYGRENQGGQVLGVDSIRLNNRTLSRVKMVDNRGRVHIRVFDPHRPESMPPRPLTDGD